MSITREDLETKIAEEKARLESARLEFREGNGSKGAEFAMFQSAMVYTIQGHQLRLAGLEGQLKNLDVGRQDVLGK